MKCQHLNIHNRTAKPHQLAFIKTRPIMITQMTQSPPMLGNKPVISRTALKRDRGHRDPPTITGFTNHARRRDPRTIKEHLSELETGNNILKRAHRHPRRTEIDNKSRDPPMRRNISISPRQQQTLIRPLRITRPRLLPIDNIKISITHSPRPQRSNVRPGIRLTKTLTPPLLRTQSRHQIPRPLSIRTILHQNTSNITTLPKRRRTSSTQLTKQNRIKRRIKTPPTILNRERQPNKTRRIQRLMPNTQIIPINILINRRLRKRQQTINPLAHSPTKLRLLHRIPKIHATTHSPDTHRPNTRRHTRPMPRQHNRATTLLTTKPLQYRRQNQL